MEWFKMGTKYMLSPELNKVQKGIIAECLALVFAYERMPTEKELAKLVSRKGLEGIDETLSRVYSTTLRGVLEKGVDDLSESLKKRDAWRENKRRYRENKELSSKTSDRTSSPKSRRRRRVEGEVNSNTLPPFANATAETEQKSSQKTPTPQSEFVSAWSSLYESETKEKFKADKKDFVIVAKLIKQYGKENVLKKSKLLFVACQTKSLWFTKGGIADFSIGKLSSRWNELIESNTGGNNAGISKSELSEQAGKEFLASLNRK